MFKNYLRTTIRQIQNNRVFSFINIFGLGLGMAACLVIAQYINFHSSFDEQIPNVNRVFRIEAEAFKNGLLIGQQLESPSPLSDMLIDETPSIERLGRFYSYNYANSSIIYKASGRQVNFGQSGVYGAEKSIFELFDYRFVAGSAEKFEEPKKAVLTLSASRKYFDSPQEAIGSSFTLSGNDGAVEYELVGVLEDPPKNSHIDFELLISLPSIDEYTESRKRWSTSMLSYVLLTDESKTDDVVKDATRIFNENAGERYAERGYDLKFYLRPVRDIHLTSKSSEDFTAGIDRTIIVSLSVIAFIILVIAWINYMNLSLVRTTERLKEMGIRKCLGSSVRQIIFLFLLEAFVMNILALGLAIGLTQILEASLIQITGLPETVLMNRNVLLLLFGFVILGSVLVGLYPYVILKTMNIVNALVGKQKKISGTRMRKALVFVQFAVTFLLISGTLTVYYQIDYMRNAELGIDIENILVIKAPPGDVHQDEGREDVARFSTLKTELLKQTGINKITNAGEIPGQEIGWKTGFYLKNGAKENTRATGLIPMDVDFPEFFQIELVAGRNLKRGDDPWTKGDVVINEKLAEMLGFSNPADAVGAELAGFYGPTLNVRGVLKNHHHTSLHYDYAPIAYILSSWTEFYFIKLHLDEATNDRRSQLAGLVKTVESEWSKVFTDYQMDYFFLDSAFDEQYKEDVRFGKIFSGFASLTILIACLGLFGLTSFTIQQRTKEIGIRKTLGAGINSLIVLLSKEYLILVGAACLLSLPVARWLMGRWLEDYTFRINLEWWIFLIPVILVVGLALFSIISKIVNTVQKNPIESLRYE